jgi:hypothetical protein
LISSAREKNRNKDYFALDSIKNNSSPCHPEIRFALGSKTAKKQFGHGFAHTTSKFTKTAKDFLRPARNLLLLGKKQQNFLC